MSKPQKYSYILIGIFLISFGLRSAHFLEHFSEHTPCTDIELHHEHNQEEENCSLCDFMLSMIIEVKPLSFDFFYPDWRKSLQDGGYVSLLSTDSSCYFSLRAPPLV